MMLLGEIFGMKLSAASDILLGRSTGPAQRNDTARSPLSRAHIYTRALLSLTPAISMRFVLGVILSAGDSNALQAPALDKCHM